MKAKSFSINRLFDTLFWHLIIFLPIILYLASSSINVMPFNEYLVSILKIDFNTESILYSSFNDLFTSTGNFFDFFTTGGFAIDFFIWFVFVEFMHVFIDVIVFIPRFAHLLMYKFSKEND